MRPLKINRIWQDHLMFAKIAKMMFAKIANEAVPQFLVNAP